MTKLFQDSKTTAPKDIKGMWNAYSYYVGGHLFTLDEIEHGILRFENDRFESDSPKLFELIMNLFFQGQRRTPVRKVSHVSSG